MTKSENIFVCIGAIHNDYLINLKKNIINYRTNPVIHRSSIGGVAYNKYDFEEICKKGLKLSPLGEILIEASKEEPRLLPTLHSSKDLFIKVLRSLIVLTGSFKELSFHASGTSGQPL